MHPLIVPAAVGIGSVLVAVAVRKIAQPRAATPEETAAAAPKQMTIIDTAAYKVPLSKFFAKKPINPLFMAAPMVAPKLVDMRPVIRNMIATVVRGRSNASHFITVSAQEDDVDLLWLELWAAFANNYFVDGEDVGYSTAERKKELKQILEAAIASDMVHPNRSARLRSRYPMMRKHSIIGRAKTTSASDAWHARWDALHADALGNDQALAAFLVQYVNEYALDYKIPADAEYWRDTSVGELFAKAATIIAGAAQTYSSSQKK